TGFRPLQSRWVCAAAPRGESRAPAAVRKKERRSRPAAVRSMGSDGMNILQKASQYTPSGLRQAERNQSQEDRQDFAVAEVDLEHRAHKDSEDACDYRVKDEAILIPRAAQRAGVIPQDSRQQP